MVIYGSMKLISHGKERLFDASDAYRMHVCDMSVPTFQVPPVILLVILRNVAYGNCEPCQRLFYVRSLLYPPLTMEKQNFEVMISAEFIVHDPVPSRSQMSSRTLLSYCSKCEHQHRVYFSLTSVIETRSFKG